MRSARGFDILEPGQILGGCIIESHLGSGSMGAVYRARQTELDRLVALKVLRPELVADGRIRARFLREAKMAANLNHNGFIRVFEVGEEDGFHYIVMEFVEGTDLRRWIQGHGPLPWRQALLIARQVAAALDHAHKKGVVHRDIKPANIILSSHGEARVADLGLARPLREDTHVTGNGELVGTPVYMSPEQCRDLAIDGRTDLYAVGSTLYTLVSGRPPFTGDNAAALIQKVLNERPTPLKAIVPGIPDEVAALVQRLMAKLPAARYQSGSELMEAVDVILSGRAQLPGHGSRAGANGAATSAPAAKPDSSAMRLVVGAAAVIVAAGALFLRPGGESSASSQSHGAGASRTIGESGLPPASPRGADSEGGGAASREPEARSAAPIRVTDKDLARRLEDFRSDLGSGSMESLLAYFRSRHREDIRLRFSLARLVEAIQADSMEPGAYVVEKEAEDAASVLLLFRNPHTSRSMGIPLEWIQQDGEWYVQPISRYLRDEK